MSAYGNPQPVADVELERFVIEGRLKVARGIARDDPRLATRRRWAETVDELLDHLAEVDARAASRAMDES